MTLQRLAPDDPPVLDPFLAAVRRRHPDVDLVVLPPDAGAHADVTGRSAQPVSQPVSPPVSPPMSQPGAGPERVSEEVLRAAGAGVDAAVDSLRGWLPGADVDLAWRSGGKVGVVRRTGVLSVRHDEDEDGRLVLARLAEALAGAGWRVRWQAETGRLLADIAMLALSATHAARTRLTSATVASAALPVGRERAALLSIGG